MERRSFGRLRLGQDDTRALFGQDDTRALLGQDDEHLIQPKR